MIYVLAEFDPDTCEQSRFVKIGYAKEGDDEFIAAAERANSLQCGNPRRLVVVAKLSGAVKDEQALHDRFSTWQVVHKGKRQDGVARDRRTEWFRLMPGSDLAKWVDEHRIVPVDAWRELELLSARQAEAPVQKRVKEVEVETPIAGPPTQRQREILTFLREWWDANGTAPTIRDLCARFGWASTNGAADHMVALRRRGLIDHDRRPVPGALDAAVTRPGGVGAGAFVWRGRVRAG